MSREAKPITVRFGRILPHEDMDMGVDVSFAIPHPNGTTSSVSVGTFVERKNQTITEIKSEAIEKAYDLLAQILAAR